MSVVAQILPALGGIIEALYSKVGYMKLDTAWLTGRECERQTRHREAANKHDIGLHRISRWRFPVSIRLMVLVTGMNE